MLVEKYRAATMPHSDVEVPPGAEKQKLKFQVRDARNPLGERSPFADIDPMRPIVEHEHRPMRQPMCQISQALTARFINVTINPSKSDFTISCSLRSLKTIGKETLY
jgi:hypothetical protein